MTALVIASISSRLMDAPSIFDAKFDAKDETGDVQDELLSAHGCPSLSCDNSLIP